MKKRFFILFLSLSLFATTLTGCANNTSSTQSSSVIQFGDITEDKTEESTQQTQNNVTNISLPTYHESDLPSSIIKERNVEVNYTSYYYDQLESRLKIVYDQLVIAIKEFQPEVALTKKITPEELQLIFNMLYLDTPNLMQLDSSYMYMVDDTGYVYIVGLQYLMSETDYNAFYSSLEDKKSGLRKHNNDYQTEQTAISNLSSVKFNQNTYEYGEFTESYEEIKKVIEEKKGNSIGIAKTLNYFFRTAGLESCVITGELVSNSFYEGIDNEKFIANSGLNAFGDMESAYYEAQPTIDIKFADIYNEGNIYYVDNHYSSLWAWNAVKIDNSWYNVDLAYSSLINVANKRVLYDLGNNIFNNVPDLTMSQTRIWHDNEKTLGISPSCNSYGFQYSYRNMMYLLPHNELQAIKRINTILDLLCGYNQETAQKDQYIEKTNYVTYQFADENTFNYFVENFDNEVDHYNSLNANVIQSYDFFYNRDSLTISIYNVVLE